MRNGLNAEKSGINAESSQYKQIAGEPKSL